MRIRIEVFGFTLEPPPPGWKGHAVDLSIDQPTSLDSLLATSLQIDMTDKTVLVNGRYVSPTYCLHEGDLVQILRMIEGG